MGIIPAATGQAVDSLNRPVYNGDPAIAASPDGTVVAMANLSRAKINGGVDRVVVSISFDGGRTFPQSFNVNDTGCYDGLQDQESIAFDQTRDFSTGQDPEFWVVFRHSGLGEAGRYGACARGARVNPDTQTLTWIREADAIDNLDFFDIGSGVGGLVVQARAGIVSVMYANTDSFGRDGNSNPICGQGGSRQVRWFINESTDNANNWTNAEYIAGPATLPCFVGEIEVGIRNFGFAQDPTGMQYFAVPAQEVSPRGSPEAIDVFRRDRGAGPAEPLVLDAQIRGSGPVFWPTLAADQLGRVGLLWGHGIGIGGTTVRYRMASRGLTRGWDTVGIAADPAQQSIFATNLAAGNGASFGIDGDYLGIAGRSNDLLLQDQPAFLGAWSDPSLFTTSPLFAVGTVNTSTLTVTP